MKAAHAIQRDLSMYAFSQLCESIAATTKKLEKIQLVADYFRSLHGDLDNASLGALYLCGRVFPRREERVLSVGFSVILRAVAAISGKEPHGLGPTLRHHGDIGAGAEEILADHQTPSTMRLTDIADVYDALARQRGPAGKQALFEEALRKLSALEAKYFIKICTGELRIGLKESLVEEGIARCYEQPSAVVQRANMLTGDISETLRLAAEGRLAGLQLELFRPISVMLASPVDTAAELVDVFPQGALVEEKFDGIRAQVHKRGDTIEMYSRTLDRITEFPELAGTLRKVPGDFILDGEIIGWRDGRAIPFTELQQRLGRKQIDLFTSTLVPVSFVAFDLLLLNGESLLDLELAERRLRMTNLLTPHEKPELQFTRAELCTTVEEIDAAFDSALAKGNEGLVAKGPQSPYVPGRRGQYWIKLKRPLATLDVVVTARGIRPRQAPRFAVGLHVRGARHGFRRRSRPIGEYRQGLFGRDRCRNRAAHKVFPRTHDRRSRPRARRRSGDRDGNRVQQHPEIQPPQLRIRAAIPQDRAPARRQTRRRNRHFVSRA